jgi:hypothetical protein
LRYNIDEVKFDDEVRRLMKNITVNGGKLKEGGDVRASK